MPPRLPAAFLALTLATAMPAAPAQAQWASDPFPSEVLGEIKHTAYRFAPRGWARCEGQQLSVAQHFGLFTTLGATFGGDGRTTFALPALTAGAAVDDPVPTPMICLAGLYPSRDRAADPHVAGLIRLVPYADGWFDDDEVRFAGTATWLPCDGRSLSRWQYPRLYERLVQPPADAPWLAASPFVLPALPDVPIQGGGRARWMIDTEDSTASLDGWLGDLRRWPVKAPVPPRWQACDGQALAIADHQALFSAIGIRFGGDGRFRFQLPRLPEEAGVRWIVCTEGLYPYPE